MTKHGGASWGKKRFTSIMLVGCKTKKAGKDCGEAPYKQDKGQFAYQAGPVRVTSGKRCIWARADLGTAGDKRIITRRDRPEVPRALLRLDIASLAGRERRR